MSPSPNGVKFVTPEIVCNTVYDAVIVGAGVAGAIVAKQLSQQGKSVLILEAGTGKDLTLKGFQSYVGLSQLNSVKCSVSYVLHSGLIWTFI